MRLHVGQPVLWTLTAVLSTVSIVSAQPPCGLYPVGDPKAPTKIDLTATPGSFAIALSWSGTAGTYEVHTYNPRTGVVHADAVVSAQLGVITIDRGRRPAENSGVRGGGIDVPAKVFVGSGTHRVLLPDTAYSYVIRGALVTGKQACGIASARTPPPAVTVASGRLIDVTHATLSFTVPPYAHEMTVQRADGTVVAAFRTAGQHFAGAGGRPVQTQSINPGPPPFPYVNGQYETQTAVYDFTIRTVWTENSDGSGASKTAMTPLRVQGPNPIVGYADLHAHQFSYLGFGGNPQEFPLGRNFFGKAFGSIGQALPPDDSGAPAVRDLADAVMKVAMYSNFPPPPSPFQPRGGNPQFDGWPRWNSFTHQQLYEQWLKRAHDGGLQLMVTHPVNNEWMCTTLNSITNADVPLYWATAGTWLVGRIAASQATIDPACLDSSAMEYQTREALAMQADIDARSGGAGMGWYRVVKSPQEARQVIGQGKLAVVLGMEVDNPFECTVNSSTCTAVNIGAKLQYYYDLGVRHFFPIHFYDNAFGGSANANFLITNAFRNPMAKRDCSAEGYEYDNRQCNANGLTPLGRAFVAELMKRGMVIDTDHMSARSFADTMSLVLPTKYPVVSSHTGFTEMSRGAKVSEGNLTPARINSILSVGGMVAIIPHQGNLDEIIEAPHLTPGSQRTDVRHACGNSSETTAQAYLYAIERVGFGPVGIGTDFNGFAGWPSPRFGSQQCSGGVTTAAGGYRPLPRLDYPFTIRATGINITMNRSAVGAKVFDFNDEGLAHIGLLPDMVADFQALGVTARELDPLFLSAEGYIRLWERANYLAGR